MWGLITYLMPPSYCLISRFSNHWRLVTNLGTNTNKLPQHVVQKQWNNDQAKYMSLYVNEQLVGVNCKLQKRLISHEDKALRSLPGCQQGTWKMVPKSVLSEVHAPTGWVRPSCRTQKHSWSVEGHSFHRGSEIIVFSVNFDWRGLGIFFKLIYFCRVIL